jgi:uncharacterized protein
VRQFWSWLGLNLGRKAGLVSLVGLIVTLSLGYGISQLKFQTDQDSFLNRTDLAYKENVAYQSTFGGDDMLTMFVMAPGHNVEDLALPANIAEFERVTAELKKIPEVYAVVSPLTALQFDSTLLSGPGGSALKSVAGKVTLDMEGRDPNAASKKLRLDDAVKTLGRIEAVPVSQRVLTNPAWVKVLLIDNQGGIRPAAQAFFDDMTHAEMLIRLGGNLSIADEGQAAGRIVQIMDASHFVDATTVTTGAPALLQNLNNYLRGGMLLLGAIAVAVMFLILMLLFDVRWRFLPLGIVLIGIIWAFGLAGYVGIPLTLATIAGLPVMLGIGIDYAIQLHSRVEEEVTLDHVSHPIQATARNLCPALLVVTFDAVFAFLALEFSKVPMIRQFGTLLAVGIAVICLGSIILPLAVLGIREFKSPTKSTKDFSEGVLAKIVVKLAAVPARAAIPLAVVGVLIFLGGVSVEGKIVIQTDPVTWVNQHSQLIENVHAVENGIGSASELDVFIQSKNVFDQQTIDFASGFQASQLATNSTKLKPPASIVSLTALIAYVPGTTNVMPSAADVKPVFEAAPPDIQRITATPSGSAMDILFPARTSSLDELGATVDGMRAVHPPTGVTSAPAGIAVVGVGLLDNLNANRVLLTYLSILFVLAFLTLRLRSFVRALLSLVPVLIAVGLATLVAYALNLKLSPATAVSGPLVVAACTEFTSLMLLRFIEERSRGLSPREAVDVMASRTGRAFIVSGLTCVAGVATVATSSLPLLQGFGIVVAFNVTIALLCALVVLPPVLVWADQRNWVSRGMLRPDPEARPLVAEPATSV